MKKALLLILSLLVITTDTEAASKKSLRKASSSGKSSKKKQGKTGRSLGKNSSIPSANVNSKNEDVENKKTEPVKENWDSAICDSEYTRCMNKVCSSDDLGKCVCYEDKFSNAASTSFINIDGMRVKKGFEAFEYAKKSCAEILDKCMENRRSITEKYKNLVQRDCLMISKTEVSKDHGLNADLDKLKSCVKDACFVKDIAGFEQYSFPEYSLCFNETYANYVIDTHCSDVIAKSTSPLGLKQLFYDEMALKREQSCKSMKGTLTNDRKQCFVRIDYGVNKENPKASKRIAVGDYLECSAKFFDAKKNESKAKIQADINKILSLTATGFSAAGAILDIVDPAAGAIKVTSTVIDILSSSADLGLTVKEYKEGKIPPGQFAQTAVGIGLSIALSAKSFGGSGGSVGEGFEKASVAKEAFFVGTNLASQTTSVIVDNKADKLEMEEEEKDIIKHAEVDRTTGQGQIAETLSEKGNCFLNGEWFATENEMIMLLWKN